MPRIPVIRPWQAPTGPGAYYPIPYLHVPGQFYYMPLVEATYYQRERQVFSYTRAGERTMHILIGDVLDVIAADPAKHQAREFAISPHIAAAITKANSITGDELSKVNRSTWNDPGIILHWPDDTQTIIDGNHRYVIRYFEDKPTMRFHVVEPQDIQGCLLDLPQDFGIDPQNTGMGERTDLKGTYLDHYGVRRRTSDRK